MKFRTEYKPVKATFTLNPEHHVLMLGSCFADNMLQKMRSCLWRADNPLGTLYNPLSIERAIRLCLNPGDRNVNFMSTIFQGTDKISHSWLFDSKISAGSECEVVENFDSVAQQFSKDIIDAQVLFVTFGTSWCYFLAESPDFVVANCHKQPADMFVRRRLSVEEIVDCWESLAADLREINPDLRIVFTVSPVRHIKDGFEGNARSKAVLLLAVEELCNRLEWCSYFPAYEIVNDDLRDYRFYASDLVHPSEQAVEYLWEIFRATYLDAEGVNLLKEGEKIAKACNHRPLIGSDFEKRLYHWKVKNQYLKFHNAHPDMLTIPNFL